MTYTIYEYDRLYPAAENTISYIIGKRQPIVGGCNDDDEGRAYSAQIIAPVDTCETIDEGRVKILERISKIAGGAYTNITERPAFQGVLQIVASLPEDDD